MKNFMPCPRGGGDSDDIYDLADETKMLGAIKNPDLKKDFIKTWKESGVNCILQSAGQECQSVKRLLKRVGYMTCLTDSMPEFISKAVSKESIIKAFNDNKRSLMLTVNGVPLAEQWQAVEKELSYIKVFYQLGARMMHLTYNRRNMLADGCAEKTNAGLSDFGEEAIRELNRVGVILDLAHTGWKSCIDAARCSSKPVVASHSGACHIFNHPRNKPDEVIKAIVDTGGYIGVCAVPFLIGGGINKLLDHIDHIVCRFGEESVAIGTDRTVILDCKGKQYEWRELPKARTPFRYFWPEHLKRETDNSILSWLDWPFFTVGLVQRGYSDDVIRKIIGGNVLRVFDEKLLS